MKKNNYKVPVMLTYTGKFFVYATGTTEAITLVENQCRKYSSRACFTFPEKNSNKKSPLIGWEFRAVGSPPNVHGINAVRESKRVLPAMIRDAGKSDAKKCYEVEITYFRSGAFCVRAKDKQEAHELVEKYGRQRYPVFQSSLPPEEVAWEFPRKNIMKWIGPITEGSCH